MGTIPNPGFLGCVRNGELHWLDLAHAPKQKIDVRPRFNKLRTVHSFADEDGAKWEIRQEFKPAPIGDAIDVSTEIKVDQDRTLAFLPVLTLFPGVGAFGQRKGQALFAGLEYLDDEPSSSEADVIGPASKRQVPDNLKITFPLMAIQSEGRYVALSWEMQTNLSALFDSPDRLFNSGGHVMGLLFPGSSGKNREEGSLLPRMAQVLFANQPLVVRATIFGGKGASVVPAIQQYVSLKGIGGTEAGRARPTADEFGNYLSTAASGWMDSAIREGNLFRHAVGGNFPPGPAADAAVWMQWLGELNLETGLAERLNQASTNAFCQVQPSDLNFAAVGHVRYPLPSLLYGHLAENAARARDRGRDLLRQFDADGSAHYQSKPGGPDFAKTHWTNEANGLTSAYVKDLLEAAAFSGDKQLLETALRHLRALDKFRNSVPRGAQTWEVPLHTPDILASAHLVHVYTLGYELTGNADFLEQARYWAWTGVPFIYLVNPTDKPIGLYGTIAVFGATQWRAPVWMGLPVQWCGLVYADALYRLAKYDRAGPWRKLADGITLSGIQQTWPQSDKRHQGLLPDSFVLRKQQRNEPAINPATLEACAARYFTGKPAYDFWYFRKNALGVHAPGEIKNAKETSGRVSFQVEPWTKQPYFVFINGLANKPALKINGRNVEPSSNQFDEKQGWLILKLEGHSKVELHQTAH
jgi:hypothetical protein